MLRGLEEEGIVRSEWRDDQPGPAKRMYDLTDDGHRLLVSWVDSLEEAQRRIAGFLDEYERKE